MTCLAQYLSSFLREYLPCERGASFNTCDTYAYTFQLLVNFAATKLKIPPSKLSLEQLDLKLVVAFLNYLEHERKNSIRTRNARCAAIKTFFKFLEYHDVACIDQSRRIQAIPFKKTDTKLIAHLSDVEMKAILDAPSSYSHSGIRDRAMINLCFSAGLRVSELIGLRLDQLDMQPQPMVHVMGKGRRERVLPLWKETANAIKAWIEIRPNQVSIPELFLNSRGCAMSRSGFEYILSKYAKIASFKQPSLAGKRITPHVLRHTIAMITLKATHDIRRVSLWLGHADLKSTEIYLRADPAEKLEMLMDVAPPALKAGKFKAPDKLMAILKEKAKRD